MPLSYISVHATERLTYTDISHKLGLHQIFQYTKKHNSLACYASIIGRYQTVEFNSVKID